MEKKKIFTAKKVPQPSTQDYKKKLKKYQNNKNKQTIDCE